MNTCPLVVTELLWIYTAESLTAPIDNYHNFTRWDSEHAELAVSGPPGEDNPGVGEMLGDLDRSLNS